MKFMLNGALTLGTMDGANVEIVEEVGEEHAFVFGLSADQVIAYERDRNYHPQDYVNNDPELQQVLNQLVDGTYAGGDTELFRDIHRSLLEGDQADMYFILADFRSYVEAQERVSARAADPAGWARSAILNMARCGKFSSDRTIEDYVKDIWHLQKLTV